MKNIKCQYCNKMFSNNINLMNHERVKHKDIIENKESLKEAKCMRNAMRGEEHYTEADYQTWHKDW